MCGRFTLTANQEQVEKRFGLKHKGRYAPRFNIAPTQDVPVIWNPQTPQFTRLKWGMTPVWWQAKARSLINIRRETLEQKTTFRYLLAHQRCLVPADGFYEWQRRGRMSQPLYFTLEKHGIFAFPALWEDEKDRQPCPARRRCEPDHGQA